MKSIRITFRLKPYQLARGLQTIRQLEPTYKLTGINDIVKTIYHDYLAKMSINKADEIPPELINEILSFTNKQIQKLTIGDLMNLKPAAEDLEESSEKTELSEDLQEVQAELSPEDLEEINQITAQTAKLKAARDFDDPNETDSEISSITDFSPPKDWME